MTRTRLHLLLLVLVALVGAVPAWGRPAARRARVDVGHPESVLDAHPALLSELPVPSHLAAALPATAPACPAASAARVGEADSFVNLAAPPAPSAASSRAPPTLG